MSLPSVLVFPIVAGLGLRRKRKGKGAGERLQPFRRVKLGLWDLCRSHTAVGMPDLCRNPTSSARGETMIARPDFETAGAARAPLRGAAPQLGLKNGPFSLEH